jgi:hypothetical protein
VIDGDLEYAKIRDLSRSGEAKSCQQGNQEAAADRFHECEEWLIDSSKRGHINLQPSVVNDCMPTVASSNPRSFLRLTGTNYLSVTSSNGNTISV